MKESFKIYITKTMLYHLVTRTENVFFFEKVIYYIANQFNLFKGDFKEVSAVKHNLMKDSMKKYLTKTYFYHLVTRTESGFIFYKVIYSIFTPFFFLMGFKRGFCSKTQPYTGLINKIPYTNIFVSPRNRDRRWFQL